MGAAAIVNDREVMERMRHNQISDRLVWHFGQFETGPGNSWLVAPGRGARRTRGAVPTGWKSTGACRTTPTSRS